MANRRVWVLILGAVTVAAAGFFLKMLLTPTPVSDAVRFPTAPGGEAERQAKAESRRAAIEARDRQLRSAPRLSLDEADNLRTLLEEKLRPPPAHAGLLTPAARAALVEKVATHSEAWLSETPDAYMGIVASEGTVWNPPEHRCWKIADEMFVYRKQPPSDPSRPAESLRRLLELRKFAHSNRWLSLGHDDSSMMILTSVAMTADDLYSSPFGDGPMNDPSSGRHWIWVKGHGLRLREPPTTPEDLLKRDRAVLLAQSLIAFYDAEDRPSIWNARWFWDPASGVWHNMMSSGHGPHTTNKMFY